MDYEAQIRKCVEASTPAVPPGELAEVIHFLDHGEYEMAFEGLVLELIRWNGRPQPFSADQWLELAENLGLRTESVFENDFWSKLTLWIKHMG